MVIKAVKEQLRANLPGFTDFSKRLSAKKWPKGSIVYYTGDRKAGLSPRSLEEGASGTSTAVIYLTKEWAKQGHKVVVYSTCGDQEGIHDGVEYINYYKFNWHDAFDVLIILSHPYLLPLPIKARKVCWEWQDILGRPKIYPRHKIERFDHIFSKSKFQRQLLPYVSDDKFTIVTNGVDKKIAQLSSNKKEPYKLIYGSRYYRGLDSMLAYGWPIIKQAIPEVELHVYHGWTRRENHHSQAEWKQEVIELMKQDGVVEHGKVSQKTLIEEKSKAAIHYYGCTYEEIDCISVRESAMVGCVPVTTDFAVFKEKSYCLRVPGEPKAKETQEAIAYKIVELLKNPQELEAIREEFAKNVQNETWENIAKVWLETFDFD